MTIKPPKMPKDLQEKIKTLTPFQRRYCEYRAKGLKRVDAIQKAGSKAKTREAMSQIGYTLEETNPIVAEYIEYLQTSIAVIAMVSENEIVDNLRRIVQTAIENDKLADATKATELLGNMIGAFASKNQKNSSAGGQVKSSPSGSETDVEESFDTEPFKDDLTHEERLKRFRDISTHLLKKQKD